MRKFYTYFLSALVLAIAAAFSASAQKKEFKVEESSARNMPEWVNSVERDFLIATASGGDIEEAKAAVIENVKKQRNRLPRASPPASSRSPVSQHPHTRAEAISAKLRIWSHPSFPVQPNSLLSERSPCQRQPTTIGKEGTTVLPADMSTFMPSNIRSASLR